MEDNSATLFRNLPGTCPFGEDTTCREPTDIRKRAKVLVAWSFVNTYYIAPRLRTEECSPNNPNACEEAGKLSRVLLWVSAVIYAIGFFVAFVIGPILSKLDNT